VYRRALSKVVSAIALLSAGSAIPSLGSAHWEGFEAADPATPAALLTFDSAVSRYTVSRPRPLQWRALFESDSNTAGGQSEPVTGADDHSAHAGAAPQTQATTQQ